MSSEIYPKDFFSGKIKLDPNLCFILMPIKSQYDDIKKAINDIVRDCGFEPVGAGKGQKKGTLVLKQLDIGLVILKEGVNVENTLNCLRT